MAAEMGGSLESFYCAFGDRDLYFIVDLPDDASAWILCRRVRHHRSCGRLRPLSRRRFWITPETIDEAVKRTVAYRS